MARAQIDEEQEENRIMAMDLSGMDGMRVSYFHRKMTEIVERQAKRHMTAQVFAAAARVAEAEEVANAEETVVEGTPMPTVVDL